MGATPRERTPDSSLALLLDPYGFIAERCRRHRSDVFEARILLRRTLCMTGPDAAALFYDNDRFQRAGAAPLRIQKTLFGSGGVQTLDGAEHRARKALFLDAMSPDRVARLCDLVCRAWAARLVRWEAQDRVVLYDALHEVLTRAVCDWAGVPVDHRGVGPLSEDLRAMFDAAGAVGPRHRRSRRARRRAERWAARFIEDARSGSVRPPEGSMAERFAHATDPEGRPLDPRTAAVELLNVLRPTVAVSVYVTFLAHALHEHPGERRRLAEEPAYADLFVQEVRRLYPFFPAVIAIVRRDFEWRGHRFPAGRRVLLDLHGTSRDPRTWEDPDRFLPDRFRDRPIGPFDMIPQGGGDHATGHRCPGEWLTIGLMHAGLAMLTRHMTYEVPPQDTRIDRRRLPALPAEGFIISGVRRVKGPLTPAPRRPEGDQPPAVIVPRTGRCPHAPR